MKRLSRNSAAVAAATIGLALFGTSSTVLANGTETLGPPIGITVASGSGTVAAGTGLFTQPSAINLSVPAGATVKQVLLYWEGQSVFPQPGDDTITINGIG